MPIGVPLKIVVAASVVLVLGLLVAAAAPVGIQPNAPGEIVVGRYNQMRTGVATDVGHITTPSVLWTFQTNGTIATSPLAADVDGDGELEVFLGEYKPGGAADGSRLGYVLDAHGKAQYTIPMRYNGAAAAAADLDGDPGVELVFSEGSHSNEDGGLGYRVFNGEDGTPVWGFETGNDPGEGFFASPALVDVDGDGELDLVAGSMDDTVYALRGVDGTPLWRSDPLGHYVRHSTPMADVDGDGELEISVHTEAGVAFLFDARTGAEEWQTDLGSIVAATPAMGDLNGDGVPEIVYSLVVDGGVAAVRGDGTILWQQTAHDFSYRGPTLVDVDGDGLVDVVEGDSDDPSVAAYRGTDGTLLWEASLTAAWASGPLVTADVDADGAMEIVVGSDLGLTILSAGTGSIEWEFALPTIRGEPLVRDIDGRGGAEILVGAGDGALYAIGVPADADDDDEDDGCDDRDDDDERDDDERDNDDGRDGRDDERGDDDEDDERDDDREDDEGCHDRDEEDDDRRTDDRCGDHDHESSDRDEDDDRDQDDDDDEDDENP